jgi:hypothetical protein
LFWRGAGREACFILRMIRRRRKPGYHPTGDHPQDGTTPAQSHLLAIYVDLPAYGWSAAG